MIFDPILDLFRGKAVTIPPLDGAFRPNTLLDDAEACLAVPAPDNLWAHGPRLFFSSGAELRELNGRGESVVIATYDAAISAIAVSGDGQAAIGLDNGKLLIDQKEIALPAGIRCPTALAFDGEKILYLCNGSATHRPSDWMTDLMEGRASGSVWRLNLADGSIKTLAMNLAFPQGLLVAGKSLVIAESWKHRLLRLSVDGGPATPILEKLPGYPARLSPARQGGAWLSLFAPRNRLVEFVLQEPAYRRDMMASMPRPYWIAPSLSSGTSFLEPLQCGGIKTMGIHKPWAPSRSYGLVARLDANFRPLASYHSRANGNRHGVTSVAELGDRLLVGAKGGDLILDTPAGEA